MLGINFDFPEGEIRSVTYMGKGPYRVWKNRLKGGLFGVWHKKYNNTETGESWNYPEFKGYYADFTEDYFQRPSLQYAETEDLFLHSAKWKTDHWHNYEPWFPKGIFLL